MDSKVVWKEGMAFDAHVGDHSFVIDAKESSGGKGLGPGPKALTLTSLAGCTAMDVIFVLKKMRQVVTGLEVSAHGTLAETHPQKFDAITVVYKVSGENLDPKRVIKAVHLSEERYCGVSETLRSAVALSAEIYLNGERIE